MNIKLDENIPVSLVSDLADIGHDVKTVHEQDMQGVSDSQLWNSIQQEKRFLITQDLDFSDMTLYKPGSHAGILLVRLREPGRKRLRQKIYELFSTKHPEDDWRGAFIVLTDHKSRIKRPYP
jgi:predicted nuclease of predicted toxin-antitoxin system